MVVMMQFEKPAQCHLSVCMYHIYSSFQQLMDILGCFHFQAVNLYTSVCVDKCFIFFFGRFLIAGS